MRPTALLAALFALPAAAADPDLAAKLKGVTFTQYAKAPGYSEGPTWHNGDLFFCSGALLRVAKDGTVSKHLAIGPAGTALRGDGTLLICDNKHKALLALAPDGKLGVLADRADGKPLASLNDVTIDARGNVFWTDPDGSSKAKPVGKVFRLAPDGTVTLAAGGLAFPNGLDVDPAGKFLYVIESQSQKILRYTLPDGDGPLGKPEAFYDLGGSGGDGCAFDAAGNLWVADFHRPETKHGRITVLSPAAKVLATLDVPAKVVSNICFGGPDRDEIFCTTGDPPGVFHAKVGVKGFAGHPGKPGKVLREIPVTPGEGASLVHPRRFGAPGGVGQVRGWYVWQKWNPETRTAVVTKDPPGEEEYTVRVLPWVTTYRHLAYGGTVDDLRPGERVNLFFNADETHPRGYLVHFQDELCQMKGHGHVWDVTAAAGTGFTGRVLSGGKPLDDKAWDFTVPAKCEAWRDGKKADAAVKPGEKLFLTWCWEGGKRVVRLHADDASLKAIQERAQVAVSAAVAQNGVGGWVDGVDGAAVRFMAFSTHWAQANAWKPGQAVRLVKGAAGADAKLVSGKNRGQYGSGVYDAVLELANPADAKAVAGWAGSDVVRAVPR